MTKQQVNDIILKHLQEALGETVTATAQLTQSFTDWFQGLVTAGQQAKVMSQQVPAAPQQPGPDTLAEQAAGGLDIAG